jgi:hypothetical protein
MTVFSEVNGMRAGKEIRTPDLLITSNPLVSAVLLRPLACQGSTFAERR